LTSRGRYSIESTDLKGKDMSNRVIGLVTAVVLLIAAAYYGSPYWAVHQMRSAAQAGEGDRLAGYVDFPALRESVKSQMQAMMVKEMQSDEMKSNPFAGLGMMLAGNMANMVVDGMVTPDNLANMINRGRAKSLMARDLSLANAPADSNSSNDPGKRPRIDQYYEGMGVFKIEMHDPNSDKVLITWVLNREGWFEWKLESMRLTAFDES
jgi:hypothetical protein